MEDIKNPGCVKRFSFSPLFQFSRELLQNNPETKIIDAPESDFTVIGLENPGG